MSEESEELQGFSLEEQSEFGPIQLLVIGFDRVDLLSGETLEELASQETKGTIRVLDLLFVEKIHEDELMIVDNVDLGSEEAPFGGILSTFLGLDGDSLSDNLALDSTMGGEIVGISGRQARKSLLSMPVGTAAGILLFEHIWAVHFRDAARRAGAYPVLQGFLTPEAVLMIGEETRAIREAVMAIEKAQIIECAALLDAVESAASAAAISATEEASTIASQDEVTAIEVWAATNTVRALIAAGVIEQYAVAEALEALRDAGLLGPGAISTLAAAQCEVQMESR